MRAIDLIGEKFGRLRVMASAPNVGKKTAWRCRCECGAETVSMTQNLRGGLALSCGCARAESLSAANFQRRAHGMTGTPTYRSWQAMIARCEYPCSGSYERYGAAGITVCAEWRDSFARFLADMGERPPGTSLDRIDNSLGYAPGNCRWASTRDQALNRRPRSPTVDRAAVADPQTPDLFKERA